MLTPASPPAGTPARAAPEPEVSLSGRGLAARPRRARRVYTLPLEKLRPVIRIAHHLEAELHIPERVILDHELVLILAGTGRLRFERETVAFQPGCLLFIPPFVRHRFDSEPGGGSHVAIHFDLAANFPPTAASLRNRSPYEVRLAHGLRLPRRIALRARDTTDRELREIVAHFSRAEPSARLRAEALLLHVLAALLDVGTTAPAQENTSAEVSEASRARIERALNHLEKGIAGRIVPADLARAAGLSPSHFTRLFRRWTGLPPGEYILRRRVERARVLLGDIGLSIKEVAARCGFDDPYHFSKVFRQIDGVPPTRFREALLAGRRAD